MLLVLLDTVVLMVLLKVVNDEDVEMMTAGIVGIATAIGVALLAIPLGNALGFGGVILAGLIGAVALGIAVSALFGVEVKRSLIIGGLFMVAHIALGVVLNLAFST